MSSPAGSNFLYVIKAARSAPRARPEPRPGRRCAASCNASTATPSTPRSAPGSPTASRNQLRLCKVPKTLELPIEQAAEKKGAAQVGRRVGVEDIMQPIDAVICGSVAVNRSGARIGKGAGYSVLEVALLIVTPDEVIQCPNRRRPRRLVWNDLTAEKIAQIPVLSARFGSG
ncbi:5-formyltetrahydrofolate cyclo-ligase [Streptomyces umbrinus]|uniref:5-formyltetrahydrofolate cyclo-ligase n=1 Tax=Streptomyces umbrinus TaxID=67370 RepID=UPI0033E7269E